MSTIVKPVQKYVQSATVWSPKTDSSRNCLSYCLRWPEIRLNLIDLTLLECVGFFGFVSTFAEFLSSTISVWHSSENRQLSVRSVYLSPPSKLSRPYTNDYSTMKSVFSLRCLKMLDGLTSTSMQGGDRVWWCLIWPSKWFINYIWHVFVSR